MSKEFVDAVCREIMFNAQDAFKSQLQTKLEKLWK